MMTTPGAGSKRDRDELISDALKKITDALVRRRLGFLIGAGMSVECGMPTGYQLVDYFLREHVFHDTSLTDDQVASLAATYPFEAVIEAAQESLNPPREALTRHLRAKFDASKVTPGLSHDVLATLVSWHGAGRPTLSKIFTTNFDRLIEERLKGVAELVSLENQTEIDALQDSGRVPVVHLHGVLDRSDGYRITESDIYDSRFDLLKNEFFGALATADCFVFVGYSLSDPDFRAVYMNFREQMKLRNLSRRTTFVVSPAADDVQFKLGQRVWRTRHAEWIPLTASDFFSELRKYLESHGTEVLRREVMRVRGIADRGELRTMEQAVQKTLRLSTDREALAFLMESQPGGPQP